jgi:hypothetical protein
MVHSHATQVLTTQGAQLAPLIAPPILSSLVGELTSLGLAAALDAQASVLDKAYSSPLTRTVLHLHQRSPVTPLSLRF